MPGSPAPSAPRGRAPAARSSEGLLIAALPRLTPPRGAHGNAHHHVAAVRDLTDARVPPATVTLLVAVRISLQDVVLELVDEPAVLLVDGGGVLGHGPPEA